MKHFTLLFHSFSTFFSTLKVPLPSLLSPQERTKNLSPWNDFLSICIIILDQPTDIFQFFFPHFKAKPSWFSLHRNYFVINYQKHGHRDGIPFLYSFLVTCITTSAEFSEICSNLNVFLFFKQLHFFLQRLLLCVDYCLCSSKVSTHIVMEFARCWIWWCSEKGCLGAWKWAKNSYYCFTAWQWLMIFWLPKAKACFIKTTFSCHVFLCACMCARGARIDVL